MKSSFEVGGSIDPKESEEGKRGEVSKSTHSVSKVTEAARVSKEVLIKNKEYSSSFSAKPVLDTRGAEESSPGHLNLKEKQITKLRCDDVP